MRRSLAWLALGALASSSGAACHTATEVTLTLTTDVKCTDLRGVTVTVGQLHEIETKAPEAGATFCDADGHVGTLVLVPSGARNDAFAVKVVAGLGKDPSSCVAPSYGIGCIVARRAVRFIPHEPLDLPVSLHAACEGVPCGETETCAGGSCVAADDARASADCIDQGAGCAAAPASPADTAGLQSGAPWPMAGACPAHTGRSVAIGPRTLNVKWSAAVSGDLTLPLASGPVVAADGTIYANSSSGGFFTVKPRDGASSYVQLAGNNINATPAIAASGTIIAGSAGAHGLYAVAPGGKVTDLGPDSHPVTHGPAIGRDGTIYVPALVLFALGADGTTKWTYPGLSAPRLGLFSAPAVGSSGILYFTARDGVLRALNPDGTLAWSVLDDVSADSAPSVGADGTIYVGGTNKVYAVNPDGSRKWVFATGSSVGAMPAIAKDGTIIVGAYDDKLYAIRPDGTLRWTADASVAWPFDPSRVNGGASAAIDGSGAVFIGAGPGKFRAFSADGQLMWEFVSPSCPMCRFDSAAIGADGTIYAHADKLYAFTR
jgi:outer membrane protein assembly factor BamB